MGNAFILFPITLTYNIVPEKRMLLPVFFWKALDLLDPLGSSWIWVCLRIGSHFISIGESMFIIITPYYPILSSHIIPYYPHQKIAIWRDIQYIQYSILRQPFGHQDGFPCQGLYTFDAGCHGRPVGSRCCSRGSGGSHRRAQRAAWRMRFRFFVGKAVGEIVGQ